MIMPRATADASAPPTPWTKRNVTRADGVEATPQARDAAVKTASPTMKTCLLPNRSPSRPESSTRPAKAIRYEFTTQARPDWVKPRSCWMVGRATVTMEPSRMIIRLPAQRVPSANQRDVEG
ncbi:hypothetical protein GA0070216_10524 [Micromonospora matsumotoense]|uniref:Uncharacterized protein n=1 Tax=Micromonospora matsumotoense TaxID=121616 RepID=A0A1C4XLS2_9ACTN|nr:hypothetical protein GA0070216_10524 [Micromonospora matsumotoense]